MATKLKNLKLTSVDLVRAGANQEADICLYKSADPQEATEKPTEAEKGIFKRFINWLLEEPETVLNEPQSVFKDDDPLPRPEEAETFDEVQERQLANDTLEDYLEALEYSIISIQIDDDLDKSQKVEMMKQSTNEFVEAMADLFPRLAAFDPRNYKPEENQNDDKKPEGEDQFDEIEEV